MVMIYLKLFLFAMSGILFAPWPPVRAADISFKNDVMPLFMRGGCNSGSCHGASRGKDGFKLSLFGYDPEGDYYRLVEEQIGRRLNLAAPDASLILEKVAGRVPHTGGKIFPEHTKYYQTLRGWIAAAARCATRTRLEHRSESSYRPAKSLSSVRAWQSRAESPRFTPTAPRQTLPIWPCT